jgi:hypothetical protein
MRKAWRRRNHEWHLLLFLSSSNPLPSLLVFMLPSISSPFNIHTVHYVKNLIPTKLPHIIKYRIVYVESLADRSFGDANQESLLKPMIIAG